jgi:superfamily II DNA or RNA helicase
MSEEDADRSALTRQIAREEARLVRVERIRNEAEARLVVLRKALSGLDVGDSPTTEPQFPQAPVSPTDKVRLFRSLFRGRADVFPTRWQNRRKKTSGYSPACTNEWAPGLCEKPRVKCGECPNQAFQQVTDRVVLDHLQGRHVIGIYPLLEDETCWLLAVDFDKGEWESDVRAFRETCEQFGVHAAVERSRSGNGAHVWFFFSEPVPAADARRLGSCLLTETMTRRHQLPLSSYDRLFPNQDTMPRGGFGNLIALPLQHASREVGNTFFVDADGKALPDQWAYLASIPRVEPVVVEKLVQDALAWGSVIGVPAVDEFELDPDSPWAPRPSRRRRGQISKEELPCSVRAVLAGRLFVEKEGLPPAFLNEIKRLAAFQNPEFYKKQAMRLSTALTPRVIGCAEELSKFVALPRGCWESLLELANDVGVELRIDDERTTGSNIDVEFHGQLSEGQERASKKLLAADVGVLVAPPGFGKTVLGVHLVAARSRSVLVLVHRTQLLEQWRSQLALFLDLPETEIGQLGGGKRKLTGKIDVAMVQSLVRKGDVADEVAGYGHVIVDECHHVPAVSFERVMSEVRAKYITGMTATPRRRDGHDPILAFQLGPVLHSISARGEAGQSSFRRSLVVRETRFQCHGIDAAPTIQTLYGQLATDPARNAMIIDDVVQALEAGRSPLVLTERRDHLEYLDEQLGRVSRNGIVLRGGMGKKERRGAVEQLKALPPGAERVVLATGRFVGEGFDDAQLDTLFLTMPVSWKGTLVQYAGRLHRIHAGKTDVQIIDYVDSRVPMLARMFEKRLRGYTAMGYQRRAGAFAQQSVLAVGDEVTEATAIADRELL